MVKKLGQDILNEPLMPPVQSDAPTARRRRRAIPQEIQDESQRGRSGSNAIRPQKQRESARESGGRCARRPPLVVVVVVLLLAALPRCCCC